jgi:3-phosphoglycerate kinase
VAEATDVKDYLASIEKLRTDAAEAALISGLATDKTKREAFARLNQHYNRLADELEQVVKASGVK